MDNQRIINFSDFEDRDAEPATSQFPTFTIPAFNDHLTPNWADMDMVFDSSRMNITNQNFDHPILFDAINQELHIEEYTFIFDTFPDPTASYEISRTPLSSEIRNDLTEVVVQNDGEYCNQQCSICLDNFKPQEILTVLPCSHAFHRSCIVSWFEMKSTCPFCRHDLQDVQQENVPFGENISND